MFRTTLHRLTFLTLVLIATFLFDGDVVVNPKTLPESATATAASPSSAHPTSLDDFHPVIKVVDGDTVVVQIEGRATTLRIIGLDTPETVDPRRTVQCFGKEASDMAKILLTGKRIRIETDESQGERDKYGRTLAYIYMENGVLFNRYMIAEGYGYEYTYDLPYRYQAVFKAAEVSARAAKKGLWSDGACSEIRAPVSVITPEDPSSYECARNAYNCSDFSQQSAAQEVFNACGSNDIHKLDSDGDGEVCESLR